MAAGQLYWEGQEVVGSVQTPEEGHVWFWTVLTKGKMDTSAFAFLWGLYKAGAYWSPWTSLPSVSQIGKSDENMMMKIR